MTQHEKWKQLLPRGVFTQQAEAEAEAEANNGEDVHFSRCHASRVLCGWGVTALAEPYKNWLLALASQSIYPHRLPKTGSTVGTPKALV